MDETRHPLRRDDIIEAVIFAVLLTISVLVFVR